MKISKTYMRGASRDPREITYCIMATYSREPDYVFQGGEQENF